MTEADRADHSRAKLDHDLIVPITRRSLEYRLALFLSAHKEKSRIGP